MSDCGIALPFGLVVDSGSSAASPVSRGFFWTERDSSPNIRRNK
jgi:hypothetical protein